MSVIALREVRCDGDDPKYGRCPKSFSFFCKTPEDARDYVRDEYGWLVDLPGGIDLCDECKVQEASGRMDEFATARRFIRNQLRRYRVTQTDLARALGMPKRHISDVIAGRTKNLSTLIAIARQLGLEFTLVERNDDNHGHHR